jgi:biopolymer transport protein ExbD
MLKQRLKQHSGFASFNMTPIIDVVFLLIIFFMLVCQFIVAENFEVNIPSDTRNAQKQPKEKEMVTTVSVMKSDNDEITYAVGSEIINASGKQELIEKIATAVDAQLGTVKLERKIVCLRIDRDIAYSNTQNVLAAIAESIATDIQLAVINK